jgi:hypothetical protein
MSNISTPKLLGSWSVTCQKGFEKRPPTEYTVLDDIHRLAPLAPNAKASDRFLKSRRFVSNPAPDASAHH